MDYSKFINDIISKEAGYSDHPSDKGGPTNFGITEVVARANGYTGHMKDMPRLFAERVYAKRYIGAPKFDLVAEIDEAIAAELIDTGVNMGPTVAAMMLQRWLNALNLRGSKYADLFVDGALGQISLDALKKFLAWRGKDGSKVMVRALNSSQAIRYLEIAEKNPTQEDFLFGWMLNRVS
jgi:lysozyme family protein